MKSSKLQKLAWVFFALVLTSTTVFAQGWGNRNRVMNSENEQSCLEVIADLTETQKTTIAALEGKHSQSMKELMEKRRATRDTNEKIQIRNEMDEIKLAHRSEVKALLTKKQQAHYNALHINGGKLNNQNLAQNFNSGNRFSPSNNIVKGNRSFRQGSFSGNCAGRGNSFANKNNRNNLSRAGRTGSGNNLGVRNRLNVGQNCTQLTYNGTLNKSEMKGLLLMREEEKFAGDVYHTFYEKYNSIIFNNITRSESAHSNAILNLINGYQLDDPAQEGIGVFTDPQFIDLFAQLTKKGNESLVEALKVGAFIEEYDIKDLVNLLEETENVDVKRVYGNLLAASENHLRAFSRVLNSMDVTYSPEILSVEAYQEIIENNENNQNQNFAQRGNNLRENNTTFQRGNGNRNARGNGCGNFGRNSRWN